MCTFTGIMIGATFVYSAQLIRHLYIYRTHRFENGDDSSEKDFQDSLSKDIKQHLTNCLNEARIRKDLQIIPNKSSGGSAFGDNIFSASAVIHINARCYAADRNAGLAVLKHEIAHIKYNDNLFDYSLITITALAAAALSFTSPTSSVILIIGSPLLSTMVSRYQESRADNFVITHSTPDELKGFRRFLLSTMQGACMKECSLICAPSYPSAESRLKKVENALESRKISLHPEEENLWHNEAVRIQFHKKDEMKIHIQKESESSNQVRGSS